MAEADSFAPFGDAKSSGDSFTPIGRGDRNSPSVLDSPRDRIIDFLRPLIGNVIGTGVQGVLADTGIGAHPALQTTGGMLGYAGIDTLMQYLKSQQPLNVKEAMSDAAKEAMINEVGGRVLNGVIRGGKALANSATPEIYSLFPTTSQALEHYGFSNIAKIAKTIEDTGAPGAKAAAQKKSGYEGFQQALKLSNIMNGRDPLVDADPNQLLTEIKSTLQQGINTNAVKGQFQSPTHYISQELVDALQGGENPFQALDDVIADKSKLSKALSLGGTAGSNVRKDLQAYHFTKMMNDATQVIGPGQARIDPQKIAQTWYDPSKQDVLNTLYGAGLKDNLDSFLDRVVKTQDDPTFSSIKYLGKGFSLGSKLLAGLSLPFSGKYAALYATNAGMAKILTNPTAAKAITAMRGAEPLSEGASLSAKAILSALSGTRLALMDDQGKKEWGTIKNDKNGTFKFEPENQ